MLPTIDAALRSDAERTTIARDLRRLRIRRLPGKMLREEFIEPLRLSPAKAANRLGIATIHLDEAALGKRRITADTDLRLSRPLKASPRFWMRLQADWDLWRTVERAAS